MEIKPARKIYALEAHITTVKYFSIEADSLEEAKEKATNEARRFMGKDWRGLVIKEADDEG
jgi:hypothetical protein